VSGKDERARHTAARTLASPRALLHDRRFRDALQRCEDSCRGMGTVCLSILLDLQDADEASPLQDCWHASVVTADTLEHVDLHDSAHVLSLLRACDAIARSTVRLAKRKSPPSRWMRCCVLAQLCADHCAELARWFDSSAISSPVASSNG
jgi:hypothetical protein